MAVLTIKSNEKDLSYILCKNPDTGMIAKKLRKGVLFGYYENPQIYRAIFFDGMDEISFKYNKYQEFEYLDSSRYCSPDFVTSTLNTLFGSTMQGVDFDHKGNYSITMEMIKIRKNRVFEFMKYFKNFDIDITPLVNNIYSLTISTQTETLKSLMQLCYIVSFFISAQNGNEINKDINIIKKLLKFCNDLDVPYFAKYLVKTFVIENNNTFIKVKDLLEYSNSHTLKFTSYSNAGQRYEQIRNRINIEKDIVDFGCGEGAYLKLSEKVNNYYAIDSNPECLEKVQRKAAKHEYENVYIMNSIEDFLESSHDEYNFIMTEVFEHNELPVITEILKKILQDDKCHKIIFTTPNKDFNQFYLLNDDEKRHPDHVFEMREQELIDYFKNFDMPITYKIKHLGDEVDNIPTSLLVEINK